MAVILLTCMTAAAASEAGSSSDPLVSKSYVDGDYTTAVLAQGEAAINTGLEAAYNAAAGTLSGSSSDYTLTSGYERFWLPEGESVTLTFGASAVLVDGGAKISSITGTVINITTGEEVTSGISLAKNSKYFCAEDTTLVITSAGGAVVTVDGGYKLSANASRALSYTDVPANEWYYSSALYIYNNELYHDYADTTFKPNEPTTRAELVYALWKYSGSPKASSAATFTDVTDAWSIDAISWAQENGIVNGYGNGMFGPNDSIERQGIATIMYRYAAYIGRSVSATTDLKGYTDAAEVGDWAIDAVKWANAEGLIVGTSATTISPAYTASRSQVATIIMRFASK